jgi:hypothetical protein
MKKAPYGISTIRGHTSQSRKASLGIDDGVKKLQDAKNIPTKPNENQRMATLSNLLSEWYSKTLLRQDLQIK